MSASKPFIIDKVEWYTRAPGFNTPDNKPIERLHAHFRALISFLQDNGLTTRTILPETQSISDDLAVVSTDLTEEGLELMRKCHRKWLAKMDRGMAPDDVRMFEKELAVLRQAGG